MAKNKRKAVSLKTVQASEREVLKDRGEFHLWRPKAKTFADRKKVANKSACRNSRRDPGGC